MSKKISNSNVLHVIEMVKDRGGSVEQILTGGKHIKLRVVTQLGNSLTMAINKGPVDPYKLRGWVRQEMNRADARSVRA